MTAHAILSASGSAGWLNCHGKLFMEKPYPNTSSQFADEGTAAHELAELCLTQGQDAEAFIGRIIKVERGEGVHKTSRQFTVDDDMAGFVQSYVDYVREQAEGGDLFIEQQVDYTSALFPQGAPKDENGETIPCFGTSDAVIVKAAEKHIKVIDLKYGRGVAVEAEDNTQGQFYGLGTVEMLDLLYEVEDDWTVEITISQPRVSSSPSVWLTTVGDLRKFAVRAQVAANHAMHQYAGKAPPKLTPGEKQCRWCKAKATCPAAAADVRETVSTAPVTADDFDDLTVERPDDISLLDADDLASKMAKTGLIEDWIKAVRAEAERRLLAGKPVTGYKLVRGRAGARAWSDATEAEVILKKSRAGDGNIYKKSIISPTQAEKLADKGTIGPRIWKKLDELTTRSEGGLSVAPESDRREAVTAHVEPDDFDVVDTGEDLT